MKWTRYFCVTFIFVLLFTVSVYAATCPVCGAAGYRYSEYSGNCIHAGHVNAFCSTCGYSESYDTEYGNHSYRSKVTLPTCSSEGFKTWTCSYCNDTYTSNYVDIDPDAHDMVVIESVAPTYSSEGYELSKCSLCGFESKVVTDPILCTHVYSEIGRVEATEDAAGTITYKCSLCGDVTYSDLDYVSPVPSETAGLAKALFSGIWGLFGIYVPGFNFTIGQFWLGVALCSVSVIVIKLLLGIGGGGVSSRTGSTSNPKISDNRKRDEY